MNKELEKITKFLSGNILSIGFTQDASFLIKLTNNKKVDNVYTLTNKSERRKQEKAKIFGQRKINIKKIRKLFKRTIIDYTFIEMSSIHKFLSTVIKDSIDLTSKTLYFVIDIEKIELDQLIKRYERYGANVKVNKIGDLNLLIINVQDIKTSKFQNLKFFIDDIIYEVQEILAYLLIGA